MAPADEHEQPASPPAEDPPPRRSPPERETDSDDGVYMNVAAKMIGTALMFIGFLNVLLSLSGGYEINVVPFIMYAAGLAIWAHAVLEHPPTRYAVIAGALALALGFFQYGEVLFWHKQVVFWTTVLLVAFFMFKSTTRS